MDAFARLEREPKAFFVRRGDLCLINGDCNGAFLFKVAALSMPAMCNGYRLRKRAALTKGPC